MLESLFAYVPLSLHVFFAFATLTLAGAAGVAFFKNIVYSAFSLLGTFVGVVGLFALMSADFLAVVQLMVYVGGILVLVLFAVMLTNRISDIKNSNPSSHPLIGMFIAIAVALMLTTAIFHFHWQQKPPAEFAPTASMIGTAFLGPYLLPFEVAGLMLLAALIAAVVIGRKEVRTQNTNTTGEQQ